MKAFVFLAHNKDGYICEVYFGKNEVTSRLLSFIHEDSEKRQARGFLPQVQKLMKDPAALANAYGQFLQKFSKDPMMLTVLEAEVGDPANFQPEAP